MSANAAIRRVEASTPGIAPASSRSCRRRTTSTPNLSLAACPFFCPNPSARACRQTVGLECRESGTAARRSPIIRSSRHWQGWSMATRLAMIFEMASGTNLLG